MEQCCTLHRAETTHLEHEPGKLFHVFRCSRRITDLPLWIVLLGQVEHDGTAFEDALASVKDCRDTAIRVDSQKPAIDVKVSLAMN